MHEQRLQDLPSYEAGTYQVIVVGAGHAGIEAALACARLGLSTLCFTINLDAVGNMPCNPAIGGTGKGPPGPGAGRPGGRDGPGRRQGLHPVPGCSTGGRAPPSTPCGPRPTGGNTRRS